MLKKNVWLELFVVLCLVLSLVIFTCASSEADAAEVVLKIGYTPPTLDKADFMGQFETGLQKGLDESGIKYELFSRSPADHAAHEQQLQIVEDLITIGVDYMVIIPTAYEGQQGAYRKVNDAGIPLIIGNYSDPFPSEWGIDTIRFCGYSHADGGAAVAEYVGDKYPKGTKMAIIYGVPGKVSIERGAKELHEANGFEIVYEDYADWDRVKAFNAVERLLMAYPEVKVIIACSSAMSIGAVQAVETAGRTGEIDIYGAGATIEELDAIEAGTLTAAWFRDPIAIGEAAAEAIILHNQGKEDEITLSWNVPIRIVDSVDTIIEYINPVTYTSMGREFPKK